MTVILKTQFGSHVYGTNVPTSDLDFKAVSLPGGREILLQQAYRSKHEDTKKDPNAKNEAGDVDMEEFSLHYYLKLLCDGQTVCLDMLFTPERFWTVSHPLWKYVIRANKDRLISSKCEAFIGYCRTQANKYGIKGSRMGDVQFVVEHLAAFNHAARIGDYEADYRKWALEHEHIEIEEIAHKTTGVIVKHLSVCGKKAPFTGKVGTAFEMYSNLFARYGERARMAMTNEGIDWKAVMHAKRVLGEAKELRATGNITFPRPDAAELLKIRKGERQFAEVSEELENGIYELESTPSVLRPEPDRKWALDMVAEVYRSVVIDEEAYVNV